VLEDGPGAGHSNAVKSAVVLLGLMGANFWHLLAEDPKGVAVINFEAFHMDGSGQWQPSTKKTEPPQTGEKIEDFYVSFAEEGATIIKYTGLAENLVIPGKIGERRVLQIGEGAFLGSPNLVKVTLPAGLQKIDSYAFAACTNLETVYLPEGVKELGGNAFLSCTNLMEINLPGTLSVIREDTFAGCQSLSNITFNQGLITIEDGAFGGCVSLSSITFNEGLITIEDGAFRGCVNLSGVFIPGSLVNISKDAFPGCRSLVNIQIASHNPKFIVREGDFFLEGIRYRELYAKDTGELVFSAAPINEEYNKQWHVIGGQR